MSRQLEVIDTLAETFKAAWHAADDQGMSGNRTRAGVTAVLNKLDGAISWHTTCLSCANMLDQLYAIESKLDAVHRMLRVIEELDGGMTGRDGNPTAYAQASLDAVAAIRGVL